MTKKELEQRIVQLEVNEVIVTDCLESLMRITAGLAVMLKIDIPDEVREKIV